MSEEKKEYRTIVKSTAIFGGVQVFQIIVSIIKSKVTAIFLGASGIGVFGLFTSTLDLVRSVASLGLNTSSVREISYAQSSQNNLKVREVITVLRKLGILTGLLGMIAVIILSPYLSKWTFGDYNYTRSFMILSLVPLFQIVSLCQLSVLQGMRRITYLAKANLYGGVIGLVFLIPLYWWLGTDGIVPVIVITAFIAMLLSFWFVRKLEIKSVAMGIKDVMTMGRSMIYLGVMLTLSAFFSTLISYLLRIFIASEGGTEQVGLFTAATSIVVSYIGLVFSAMSTDFFPRLSSVSNDNHKMQQMINQQAEVGVLILTPMIIFFLIFSPYILEILYSSKFVPVSQMMRWMMLAVVLQASSWPLAFSLLAKANNKVYLLKEIGSSLYYITFSVLGYKVWGLDGLGIGYIFAYVCNLIQGSLINKFIYDIKLTNAYFKVLIFNSVLVAITFLCISYLENRTLAYIMTILILLGSVAYSYLSLDRLIGITELVKSKFTKK